jgi:hypothetical protein
MSLRDLFDVFYHVYFQLANDDNEKHIGNSKVIQTAGKIRYALLRDKKDNDIREFKNQLILFLGRCLSFHSVGNVNTII